MRWAEHSCFTMVMRTHESNNPEQNVQFDTDDEILNHLARMTQAARTLTIAARPTKTTLACTT